MLCCRLYNSYLLIKGPILWPASNAHTILTPTQLYLLENVPVCTSYKPHGVLHVFYIFFLL